MGNVSPSQEESFHAQYTLGKQLGKGAQGRVHACVSKHLGISCAVKMIDRNVKTSWTTFRREVELCNAGASRNVVRVLEEFVDSSYCYIVMERYEGHLRKGLKWVAKEDPGQGTGLGDASLRCIMRQVLSAIHHLHGCDIVHRDVKSHNVFIDRLDVRDERCRVVIGDLGLARKLECGRFLSAQVGTRKYWAPELYDKRYSHVVDVFALGVLLFLVISARYPFLDEEQTRSRDVFAEGVLPEDASHGARGFLQQLLQRDPLARPLPAKLLEDPWLLGANAAAAPAVAAAGRARPRRASAFPAVAGEPRAGRRWVSPQVTKPAGDAADVFDDEFTTGPASLGDPASEADSAVPESGEAGQTPPRACNDFSPMTPTTTAEASLAGASPSTDSSCWEQDIQQDAHSWQSLPVRIGEPVETDEGFEADRALEGTACRRQAAEPSAMIPSKLDPLVLDCL